MTPNIILAQLIIFVPVSIFSPLLAMTASLEPMNIAINSLGVAAAVAIANIRGCTVGKVEIAPLEILYGNGHSLIMTKSLRPSCSKTRDKASNLRSFATMLLTKLESSVRETMKEHVDPTTVADATMGQLLHSQLSIECFISCSKVTSCNSSSPPWKSIYKAGQCQARRISYNRGKCCCKTHKPKYQPSSS